MAIELFGHSALTITVTQGLIDTARTAHPEWFDGPIFLDGAKDLGPYSAEISADFGIQAQCRFGIFLQRKDCTALLTPATRYLYELFAEEHLIIIHGMDSVWRP